MSSSTAMSRHRCTRSSVSPTSTSPTTTSPAPSPAPPCTPARGSPSSTSPTTTSRAPPARHRPPLAGDGAPQPLPPPTASPQRCRPRWRGSRRSGPCCSTTTASRAGRVPCGRDKQPHRSLEDHAGRQGDNAFAPAILPAEFAKL